MRTAIIYATREGQTRRIAEYLAGALQARNVVVDLFDARESDPDLKVYDAIIVAGSIHVGKHESELVSFVKRHRAELEGIPTAFLSVSMSQAGVEMASRTPEQRLKARHEVTATLENFHKQTGWTPRWVQPVAGALLYTQYNFLIRFIMKLISQRSGGSVDTTRDHEYTDWAGLERFVDKMVGDMEPAQPHA